MSEAIVGDRQTGAKDGISIIISDFLTDNDWKRAVDYLRFKGREVLLVQILASEEISPNYMGRLNLIDSESASLEDGRNMRLRINSRHYKAYEEAVRSIRERIRAFCVSRRAGYACIDTGTPVENAIFRELLKAGALQ